MVPWIYVVKLATRGDVIRSPDARSLGTKKWGKLVRAIAFFRIGQFRYVVIWC